MITLNIGLKVSAEAPRERMAPALAGKVELGAVSVLNLLEAYLGDFEWQLRQSDTEPTLVVRTPQLPQLEPLYILSDLLGQDCIAVKDFNRSFLVGARSAKWGEFNAEYFIEYDDAV